MTLTLDFEATPEEQDELLTWAKTLTPALAQIHRLRLDAEDERPGIRLRAGPLGLGELEVAVSAQDGVLVCELEAFRGKLDFGPLHSAAKVDRHVWGSQARKMVAEAALTLPAAVHLTIDTEPRFVRVTVDGWALRSVLVSAERLMIATEKS
jgi:hypothetical protein